MTQQHSDHSKEPANAVRAELRPRRRKVHVVMLVVVLAVFGGWVAFGGLIWVRPDDSAHGADQLEEQPDETQYTVSIPLKDGEYSLGELLAAIADELGMNGDPIRSTAKLRMDPHGFMGRNTIEILEKTGVADIEIGEETLDIEVDRIRIRRSRGELHADLRALIERWFPDEAAKAISRHGMFVHQLDGTRTDIESATLPGHVVVMIHGLDEPGRLWHALIPALHRDDFTPVEVRYPNDQAIAASAQLFSEHLESLKAKGVERVSIVSHSMGGLISREVLTNPVYYAGYAMGHERYPDVERLIMAGTPNHGSPLARIRTVTEIRDQIVQLFSGDGLLFGGLFDGAGEAQVDLLPESEFLASLNARPLPQNVRLTIIAGIASPVKPTAIEIVSDELEGATPDGANGLISNLKEGLSGVVEGVGDGCVSLESTRIEGVDDHVTVTGNHLTMIRNQLLSSDRVPPGVPIVLDRLISDREAREGP